MAVAEAPPIVEEAEQRAVAVWADAHFDFVEVERFMVDPSYQRITTSLVKWIAEDFDPIMVGALIGSERKNGKIALVDGQHRWEGAKLAGVSHLPVVIHQGLSKEQEAVLFGRLQRERRSMFTWQRFKADLVGRQPTAVGINKVLKKYDLYVGPRGQPGAINSVTVLERIYSYDNGPELLDRTIRALQTAYSDMHKTENVFAAGVLKGTAAFIRGVRKLDENKLIDRLSREPPEKLQMRAQMLSNARGGSAMTHMAEVIMDVYSRRS